MDQEFRIDLSEVRRSVERAEVVTVHFIYFRETLVLDARTTASDGPMVRVRPAVNAVDDRIRDIRSLRPQFGRPESITYIPWPKFVLSLTESGVWDVLVDRIVSVSSGAAEHEMTKALRRLRRDEWHEFQRAIGGKGYKTLWERTGTT